MTEAAGRQRESLRMSATGEPVLVESGRARLAEAVRRRVPHYAPSWLGAGRDDDAGEAFLRVFGDLGGALASRINQLPEKAYVEFLRAAGVEPELGIPAETLVRFTVSQVAKRPVFISRGFRLGASPASGDLELVEFETTRDLFASPGQLSQVLGQEGAFFRPLRVDDTSGATTFVPLGRSPRDRRALWFGILASSHPGERLTFAVGLPQPSGAPSPHSSGGVTRGTATRPLVLSFDILDGRRFLPATVLLDETNALTQGGLIEVQTPRSWSPSVPAGASGEPLYWLRVRIAYGEYEEAPRLTYLFLNTTRAEATVTVRNEVLEPLDGEEGQRWQLARRPVVPGSLLLEVLDPTAALTGEAEAQVYREVETLEDQGPFERVYTFDAADGVVRFGDGIFGAKLPIGFRHIRARKYRVSFGEQSAIDQDSLTTLLSTAPFLLEATNPTKASGGRAPEARAVTLRRGPQELRAKDRAVAEFDYGLLATEAPGATVERALGVSGYHPGYPGALKPGVVGLLVVGARREQGPPLPDRATLGAVAEHLSARAPAGVEVVTAAPRFHTVRAEVGVIVDPQQDPTGVVVATVEELDTMFDPLRGGGGQGWAFGGAIRVRDVMRRLQQVPGIAAVATLTITVDGVRAPACEDIPISQYGLLWPESHEVTLIATGGNR